MKAGTVDEGAAWPVTLIVITTLIVSAIRGLGNLSYGPLPALAQLEAVKFLDPALVLAIGGLAVLNAIARGTRTFPAWKVWWGASAAVILVIGIASALFWEVPAYDAAQSIFFVLRPAILLLVFTAFTWHRQRPWAQRAIVAFALANLALVVVEWLAARAAGPDYSSDAIIGLLHDAHQQATFSYTLALLSIVPATRAPTWPRRMAWTAFIALNALGGYVSQAQKSTGIEGAVFVGALVVLVLRSRTRLLRAAKLVPAAALTLIIVAVASGTTIWTSAAELASGNFMNRLEEGGYRGLAFVDDLGAVRMMKDFWWLSSRTPVVVFLGAGPANYGSPAALRRVEQGRTSPVIRELFWWEATREADLVSSGELRLLGLSAKTSLPGIILGEFGSIALLAFLPLVLWPLVVRPRTDSGGIDRRALFWLKTAYLGVVLQSAVNTLGAWDNDVVLTLLFAGFAATLAAREPAESS